MNETEISELYNFNYNCVYNNIKNDEEAKSQYKYDLLQIISESDNDNLYHIKLYGIFIILNNNKDTKHIFNLLRKKCLQSFTMKTILIIILSCFTTFYLMTFYIYIILVFVTFIMIML